MIEFHFCRLYTHISDFEIVDFYDFKILNMSLKSLKMKFYYTNVPSWTKNKEKKLVFILKFFSLFSVKTQNMCLLKN